MTPFAGHYLVGCHVYARQPENASAVPLHPAVARVLLAAERAADARGGHVQAEADSLAALLEACVAWRRAQRTFGGEAPHGC